MKKYFLLIAFFTMVIGCDEISTATTSDSGVSKATTTVEKDTNGNTIEQNNIISRLKMDNTPGSIKHFYVLSAYSGQVILYSTVKGKVTSSGKRLNPLTVSTQNPNNSGRDGIRVEMSGNEYRTAEVLQDDGTYGSSVDYLYWWDVRGAYHQLYPTGGQIIHISDQPMPVKNIIVNFEQVKE